MEEILKNIFKILKGAFKYQSYEYRFLVLNGSEPNKQIKISNSIEYEFINSGNSKVIINDTLILYPYWMGVEPVRAKLSLNKNEVDSSVYEYRFENVQAGELVWGYQYTAVTSINIPIGFDPTNALAPFNKLQVIVKQKSTEE